MTLPKRVGRHWQPGDPRAAVAARLGGLAGAKTKRIRAIQRAAVAAGCPLTPREAELYRKAYSNGYIAGQKTGSARGYRRGFADALGEQRESA